MDPPMCMDMSFPCPFANKFPVGMPFSWWSVPSASALPGACCGVFFLGLLRRLLPALRLELFLANALPAASLRADDQSLLAGEGAPRARAAQRFAPLSARARPYLAVGALRRSPLLLRIVDALVFGAASALGFVNMLVVCVVGGGLRARAAAEDKPRRAQARAAHKRLTAPRGALHITLTTQTTQCAE